MKLKAFCTAIFAILSISASAQSFFSTEDPDKLFNLGVRVGVNTSNVTVGQNTLYKTSMKNEYNVNSWGTGFDAGIVADLNIKDYISIQPGVFFQSRSGEFAYVTPYFEDKTTYLIQAGHWNSYWVSVPVLASFHFNVTSNIRWNVDLGPYIDFNIGSKRVNRVALTSGLGYISDNYLFNQKPKAYDAGVKIGTGFEFCRHYYIGVHYMAGLTEAWKDLKTEDTKQTFGGKNKAWTFSIGYNF